MPNILHKRVTSGPTIEAGRSQQGMLLFPSLLAGEVLRPEENVPPREGGHHGAHELSLVPIKEHALAREQEGEFVRVAEGYGYVGDGAHGGASGGVHEVEGRIVGLLEVLACGKFGEGAAVQVEDYLGVKQEVVGGCGRTRIWFGGYVSGWGGGYFEFAILAGGKGGGGRLWL